MNDLIRLAALVAGTGGAVLFANAAGGIGHITSVGGKTLEEAFDYYFQYFCYGMAAISFIAGLAVERAGKLVQMRERERGGEAQQPDPQ